MGSEPDVARRFFLAQAPRAGRARLAPDESHHASRVLRLRRGQQILGLDGCGNAWPAVIRGATQGERRGSSRELEVEVCGEPIRQPAPGQDGAPLPWIEIAVSLPRAGRAEEMIDRLTQLGVAAVRPLACAHTPPATRELSPARLERLRRAAAEACKQSGRLWVPEVHPIAPFPTEGVAGDVFSTWDEGAFGDLDAGELLATWAHERVQPSSARLGIAIGPEGGWDATERELLSRRGWCPVSIGPHVLRVETAAGAALAIVANLALRRGR